MIYIVTNLIMLKLKVYIDRKKSINLIIQKLHGFSHQFPIVQESTTKLILWGEPGKLVLILFPQYGCFFHYIPILRYTSSNGKCMCFLINFPQHGKRQQNPLNEESLKNCFPHFFRSMGAFFHYIPILWYTSSNERCMSFLISFPQHGKRQQNPLNGKAWEIFSHTFSIVWMLFSIRPC